ncbi:MAG: DUF3098 domain-containing protein [Saprospiraceae bacterium]
MANTNTNKKKVVISTKTAFESGKSKVKISKNKVKSRKKISKVNTVEELSFGKKNFQLVILGIVLIAVGMLLMMGGGMPSPEVWDESRIYSFRRITLAPIVIIAGLIIEIYAIFKD